MINKIIKFLANANLALATITVILTIIEWKLIYISEDVFFRFAIDTMVCLTICISVKKIKILNKVVSHIIASLIVISNLFFICRPIFTVNGFVIAVPPNFKGQVYIKMNDDNSNTRLRPFNGVVVFPVNSKGQLFTKSYYNVSEFEIFSMELINGHLTSNDKKKLTDIKITQQGLNDSRQVVITGYIH